jgi:hypothetical protein
MRGWCKAAAVGPFPAPARTARRHPRRSTTSGAWSDGRGPSSKRAVDAAGGEPLGEVGAQEREVSAAHAAVEVPEGLVAGAIAERCHAAERDGPPRPRPGL